MNEPRELLDPSVSNASPDSNKVHAAARCEITQHMRIGLAIGHAGAPFADSLELARRAEEAGLAAVAVGDASMETFSGAAAVAAVTSRIGIVSGIATWTRTPVTTAHTAAAIQGLANGRYRLGLGPMPRAWSEGWHGIDYARPVERMRDYVAAIRAALAATPEAPTSHSGPFYSFSDYPGKRITPDHPVPIHLAATRPRMTELAGEIADGVLFNTMASPAWLAADGRAALDRGLTTGGRTRAELEVGVLRICAIDPDPRRAYDLARPGLAFYWGVPYFADALRYHGFEEELAAGESAAAAGDWAARVAAVSDRMVHTMCIAGTAADVRERVTAYEGLVDWLELAGQVGHPPEVSMEQAERIIDTFRTDR